MEKEKGGEREMWERCGEVEIGSDGERQDERRERRGGMQWDGVEGGRDRREKESDKYTDST